MFDKSWAVFPLFPIVDGKCGCGDANCKAVGKHPAYAYSTLGTSEQIAGRAGCGYGIATGERSGVFVLDADNADAVAWVERQGVPTTYTVKTARGKHWYFQQPEGVRVRNSASELAPGVDIRGEGGFAVIAGSPHKSGAVYAAEDPSAPIAPAPSWLLSWGGLAKKDRGEGAELDGDENAAAWTLATDDPRWAARVALAAEKIASWPLPDTGEKGVRWRLCQFLTIDCALPVDVARDLLYADGYPDRCADWDEYHVVHSLKRALRNESDRVPGSVDMAGFQARAEAFLAQQTEAAREARTTPVTTETPHEYKFDPCNVVRELQYVEAEDGSKKAKKPYKPDIDEIVFDLNTEDAWAGVFRYNEFDNKVYAFRPPCRLKAEKGSARLMDSDVTSMRVWFITQKRMNAKKEEVQSAVELIAHANSYHPVREWLSSLPAATTSHLDNLAAVLFGDERPIAQLYIRNQLIASVARIMDPGCQVDTVLTLVGPAGGERKSTTIRELYSVPGCPVTFRDSMPDLRDNLKVGQAVEGFWAIELAELEAVRRADYATTKATLTRRVETYSPKYVAGEITRPRAFVFWASSNPEDFLPGADPAFRRRFWPVRALKKADLAWLAEHRAEIWSEARALYEAGEQWWFDDESQADEGRQEFIADDPMIQTVREAIDALIHFKENAEGRVFLTAKDIYMQANLTLHDGKGASPRPPKGHEVMPIHAAMKELKYEKKKIKGDWGYWVPCRQLTAQRIAEDAMKSAERKIKDEARRDFGAVESGRYKENPDYAGRSFEAWWESAPEAEEYRQEALKGMQESDVSLYQRENLKRFIEMTKPA